MSFNAFDGQVLPCGSAQSSLISRKLAEALSFPLSPPLFLSPSHSLSLYPSLIHPFLSLTDLSKLHYVVLYLEIVSG